MEKSALRENILLESYFNAPLPPLWEVVYQEAIRGHHLLFSKLEIANFESDRFKPVLMTEEESDQLADLVTAIAHCSDLQSMLDMIEAQSEPARYALYNLYKKMLSVWGDYRKQLLN